MINLATGGMGSQLRALPAELQRQLPLALLTGIVGAILLLIIGTLIYTAFGALGGFLGISLFFKDRQQK